MEKVEDKPTKKLVPLELHRKARKDSLIPLSQMLCRVLINFFYICMVLSVLAFSGDYTITSITTGGRTIPQQPDEIIGLLPGDKMLKDVPSMTALTAGEVVMHRRFSAEEYRFYEGVNYSPLSGRQ